MYYLIINSPSYYEMNQSVFHHSSYAEFWDNYYLSNWHILFIGHVISIDFLFSWNFKASKNAKQLLINLSRSIIRILTSNFRASSGFQTVNAESSFESYWKFMRSAVGPVSKGMLAGPRLFMVTILFNCIAEWICNKQYATRYKLNCTHWTNLHWDFKRKGTLGRWKKL